MNLRQDETNKQVEENRRNIVDVRTSIEQVKKLAEEARHEARSSVQHAEALEARVENGVADELREREARKLNLVMHGVEEVSEETRNPRDRAEADKQKCMKIMSEMRLQNRIQIRFCRRIGKRGSGPRPVVFGLYMERDRQQVLDNARELRYTSYEHITIVPDLTKSQRRSEQRLREEADKRNNMLSTEDRDKNLKWLVVGKRGEKR